MGVRRPTAELVIQPLDSRRWEQVQWRDDDIVVAGPMKTGNTWMIQVVCSLLWPNGEAPGPAGDICPWVEGRGTPFEVIEAPTHRRCLRTHCPPDCLPISEEARYVVIFRPPRDALLSWANHRASVRRDIWQALMEGAEAAGVESVPFWTGDMNVLFEEWVGWRQAPPQQLTQWWELRSAENVLLVHYNDLSADLDSEMRRIAEFLQLDIPENRWPSVVEGCRFEQTKQAHRSSAAYNLLFEDGAERFFHHGVPGRGETELEMDLQNRILHLSRTLLTPEARRWLEAGSSGVASSGVSDGPTT